MQTKTVLLASLLALTPFVATAQPVVYDHDPDVAFDVTGTFPANMPVSRLTAPNAAFLMEVAFEQTPPAFTAGGFELFTGVVSGSYTFEGHTYRATSGN
jgi:hypothetical protein